METKTIATPGPVERWEASDASVLAYHRQALTQVDALAPDILRVRLSPGGAHPPPRPWDPVLALPPASLRTARDGGTLRLATAALVARLDLESGAVGFATPGGVAFAEDLGPPGWREVGPGEGGPADRPESPLPPGPGRLGLFLDKGMASDEAYYGLGQRTGSLDRRRRRLTHWTVDRCTGHHRGDDNLYQAHPVLLALRPGLAWGLYLHSTWYSGFDLGAAREQVLGLFTLGGTLDYYIFAGPTPAAVVEQQTRLTGRPALPPLWALGYHQSRWGYGSDREVRALAAEFRARGIPLDAIHLDIEHMDGYRVFTWDPRRFPDPAATLAALHDRGVRAVAIVDPGVKRDLGAGYGVADSGLAGNHFIRRPDGGLFVGWVWPGESLLPDFCRAATRRWWGDLHAGHLALGIDGIWCDMNEPSIADRPFGTPGVREKPVPLASLQGDEPDDRPTDGTGDGRAGQGRATHAETHNLYGTLMARAAYEGQERLRPGRRPWVLTRSGYPGVQRWATSWMGDNRSWWEHLELALPQLGGMGLSGSPLVGVDIGGFGDHCHGELYARWMEQGAFYPFMRCHCAHDSRPQEPWAFGAEIEAIARETIALRYRLLPYLYTLAHRAHRTGEPLLRPLLYDFPDCGHLHPVEDQAMVGPAILIAPVSRPGIRRRLVELPPGTWYDLRTGARADPGPLIADAPLGRMPVYVRGGSVLTLANPRESTAAPLTELTLEVYPDARLPGDWTLIEDDGESWGYRDGALAETGLRVESLAAGAAFDIAARRGGYLPHPRRLLVRLHLPEAPKRILLDGVEVPHWHWDGETRAAELRFADDGGPHRAVPTATPESAQGDGQHP